MSIMPATIRTTTQTLILALVLLTALTACREHPAIGEGIVSRRHRSHTCYEICVWEHSLVIRSGNRRARIKVPEHIWAKCPPRSSYPACGKGE